MAEASGHVDTILPRRAGATHTLRRTRMALSACRLLPHIIILLCSDGGVILAQDMLAWARILHRAAPASRYAFIKDFVYFMTFMREFRNLFYLRCGMTARLFTLLCPPLSSLEIVCPRIGPGLFIQHGENSFVSARRIGENCWIGRHVVIGYSNDFDMPTLGDNVRVFAGAKIIGNVDVGDNATVGLNTVVMGNVPPGATVLGVPGRVIWRSGSVPPAGRLTLPK